VSRPDLIFMGMQHIIPLSQYAEQLVSWSAI
jgi:hypothetical protein